MSGIKEALRRVSEGRNEGVVIASGTLRECSCLKVGQACSECSDVRYLIIRLNDGGTITQYSSEDIHIDPRIGIRDKVMLILNDNWNATWAPHIADDDTIAEALVYPHPDESYRVSVDDHCLLVRPAETGHRGMWLSKSMVQWVGKHGEYLIEQESVQSLSVPQLMKDAEVPK